MSISMHETKQSIRSQKKYQLWCKCMSLGEKTGCHQLPERSFYIKGYQMPVCARCSGVIAGYLFAIVSFFHFGFRLKTSIIGCLCMLADWTLQQSGIKHSTNSRRLITGILGGFGIMSIQLHLIKKFISYIKCI